MSGIAGIVHRDGAPVDRALLDRMTASMGFRGPDAAHTWMSGGAAFGHTLLRTTPGSDHQPCSVADAVWMRAAASTTARGSSPN